MKTESGAKVSAVVDPEDKVRKHLHLLQPAATDKENLVGGGRMLRSSAQVKETIKSEVTEKSKTEEKPKHKKITSKDKAVQTARGEKIKIEIEDLTSEAGPSENYWEVLAERRRLALEDTLERNKELEERAVKLEGKIAKLEGRNARLEEEALVYKEMLDESRAIVDVLQEMIGEDRNDINNSLEDTF